MEVDPRKVNLAESDIEQYLWENPGMVNIVSRRSSRLDELLPVVKWLKRQYHVPSGIIDLFGVMETGELVVVEVKNVEVRADAKTQVKRYAFDIDQILSASSRGDRCIPVIVCPPVTNKIFTECEACGVTVNFFEVSFSLDVFHAVWSTQTARERQESYRDIAQRELPGNVWAGDRPSFFGSDDVPGQTRRKKSEEQKHFPSPETLGTLVDMFGPSDESTDATTHTNGEAV